MQIAAYLFAAMALFSTASGSALRPVSEEEGIATSDENERRLTSFSSTGNRNRMRTLTLTITNEAFNQPFGGFFVMVHNHAITPVYTIGQPASDPLYILAENGNPGPLVSLYQNDTNVLSAIAFTDGAPYVGGETFQITIQVNRRYPLVSIASMAINTNDCFVGINGERLRNGMQLDVPGLDSGTEENNELCASIPGPGCAAVEGNIRSLNGEGFVHVHRGFFGIGDLPADRYDWRNPMLRVVVS